MADRPRETADDAIQEAIRRCEVSRTNRREIYEGLRAWYERGTENLPAARYNKLRAHLDRVASYLFAPDTVRFGPHFPPALRAPWLPAADIIKDEFRSTWSDSGADLAVAGLLEWALVYGATVGKVQHDPATGFRIGFIHPGDFGVSREDVAELDEQDTMAHWYTLSLPQVERWAAGSPRRDALLAIAHEHARSPGGRPSRMALVVTGAGPFPSGTVTGGFPGEPLDTLDTMGALVDEPIVPFVDLWERRDFVRRRAFGKNKDEQFEDWRVTTCIAGTNQIVVQRRNPDLPWVRTGPDIVLPAEHPFGMMVPRRNPDYLWGTSELAGLRQLQEWIETLLSQVGKAIERELDPANFFSGVSDWEEAGRAMQTPGGAAGSDQPGAKMETLKVQLGENPFKLLQVLERLFNDLSGLTEAMQGQGVSGIRAQGQLETLAGIGAGRIRKMALVVEDGIGVLATKGFHTLQRHDTTAYPLPDGGAFLLAQVPPGLTLKVSAHSSAPIYREQTMATLGLIKDLIPEEDVIELADPPGRDELKLKAKEKAKGKAEMAREMLRIKEEQALKGRVGRPPA